MGVLRGGVGIWGDFDVEIDDILRDADFEKVSVDGFFRYAGIVDDYMGIFGNEIADDIDGGRFAGVVGVLFEGKAEDGDAFSRDGVEEGSDDFFDEARFLPIVHRDDGAPVISGFRKAKGFAEVDEIEDVFLETGASEADGRAEKFGSDAAIAADGTGYFIDISTGGLAEGRRWN